MATRGVTTDAGSDSASDSGKDAGDDVGNDSGCPQPPSAPIYACDAALPDAQGCGPWGSTASSPVYPMGCVVTTTQEGTYCGPVTCNCSTEPVGGGVGWTCPL